MKVVLYAMKGNFGRAEHVARAMREGLARHGMQVTVQLSWRGEVAGDFAIAYGWTHEPVFMAYRKAGGHFAYFDLGYWDRMPGRSKGGCREGSYRLAIDSWDTADGMRRGCPSDRWETAGIDLQEPPGTRDQLAQRPVLVPGMSPKAARTHGLRTDQWEQQAIAQLRTLVSPGRQVVFRPKNKEANIALPIVRALRTCGLAAMHHSNVAVDALIQGVPVFAVKGVGKLFSYATLEMAAKFGGPATEHGLLPGALDAQQRVRLLSDIAYAQWTASEMRTGLAWDHIKGLICG